MFWNRKSKPIGKVLKLFKIISSDDRQLYDTDFLNKIVRLVVDDFFNNDFELFNQIEKNYSSRAWKSIDSFFNSLKSSKNKSIDIVYLSISGNEYNTIIYSNELSNQLIPDKYGIIEFCICSELKYIQDDKIIKFIKELIDIFPIDYGYCFNLEKNMSIMSEKKYKTSLFGTSESVTKEDIELSTKLLSIKNGYFPKLYYLNILNKSQFNNIDFQLLNESEIIKINEDVKILIT